MLFNILPTVLSRESFPTDTGRVFVLTSTTLDHTERIVKAIIRAMKLPKAVFTAAFSDDLIVKKLIIVILFAQVGRMFLVATKYTMKLRVD